MMCMRARKALTRLHICAGSSELWLLAGVAINTNVHKGWPRGYKTFSMLKSAEHEIYPAHNVKMPTIVQMLAF